MRVRFIVRWRGGVRSRLGSGPPSRRQSLQLGHAARTIIAEPGIQTCITKVSKVAFVLAVQLRVNRFDHLVGDQRLLEDRRVRRRGRFTEAQRWMGRDQDGRDHSMTRPYLPQGLKAGDAREPLVDEHAQPSSRRRARQQGLAGGEGLDGETRHVEREFEAATHGVVIVDDQHAGRDG